MAININMIKKLKLFSYHKFIIYIGKTMFNYAKCTKIFGVFVLN